MIRCVNCQRLAALRLELRQLVVELIRLLPARLLSSRLGWRYLAVWAIVNDKSVTGYDVRENMGVKERRPEKYR